MKNILNAALKKLGARMASDLTVAVIQHDETSAHIRLCEANSCLSEDCAKPLLTIAQDFLGVPALDNFLLRGLEEVRIVNCNSGVRGNRRDRVFGVLREHTRLVMPKEQAAVNFPRS